MANEKRLIDVNKVISSMQKILDEEPDKKGSVAYFTFEAFIECLKQEPAVDAVEVVHGRWVKGTNIGCGVYFRCSACGVSQFLYGYLSEDAPTAYKYCPNCGAKMDGDGNE